MNSALYGMPFEIVSSVESPIVVRRVELRRLHFKNLEAETIHIPNQYHRPQIRILLCGLLNAGVPNFQNLPASFLDVRKGVVVAERENWSVAPGNQANSLGRNGIS